ncbi:hypothetical protein PPL_05323 [Heterostelium album PN500]|uniref:Uncharacterized protein n=1 Tax=Heterostelium pallidum (strain ATCC 26659 / Pp 5 / PN500) TaxID=670386 RepID=D3BBD3_HETP5|nr:hypothetical protein PPL_05323 [Heterostelium album PN500]EFA81340.1 hypothetical protein PPL_05323 [Heterostelium album PN500]|eukprot:XP_020433458.1 hypothetical protein PPL_05323 [Heterostelium album PN500]
MNDIHNQYISLAISIKAKEINDSKALKQCKILIDHCEDLIYDLDIGSSNPNNIDSLKTLLFQLNCQLLECHYNSEVKITKFSINLLATINQTYKTIKKQQNSSSNNNNTSNINNNVNYLYNFSNYLSFLYQKDESCTINDRDMNGFNFLKEAAEQASIWHQNEQSLYSAHCLCDSFYSLAEQYLESAHEFSMSIDILNKVNIILEEFKINVEFYKDRYDLLIQSYCGLTEYDNAKQLLYRLAERGNLEDQSVDQLIDKYDHQLDQRQLLKAERETLEYSLASQSDSLKRIEIQIDILDILDRETIYYDMKLHWFSLVFKEIQQLNYLRGEINFNHLFQLFSDLFKMIMNENQILKDRIYPKLIDLCNLYTTINNQPNEYIIETFIALSLLVKDKNEIIDYINQAKLRLRKEKEDSRAILILHIQCYDRIIDLYSNDNSKEKEIQQYRLKKRKKQRLLDQLEVSSIEEKTSSLDIIDTPFSEEPTLPQPQQTISKLDKKSNLANLVRRRQESRRAQSALLEEDSLGEDAAKLARQAVSNREITRRNNVEFSSKWEDTLDENGQETVINKKTGKSETHRHLNQDYVESDEYNPEEYDENGEKLPCYTDDGFVVPDSEDENYFDGSTINKRKKSKQKNGTIQKKHKPYCINLIEDNHEEEVKVTSTGKSLTFYDTEPPTQLISIYQKYLDVVKSNGNKENKKLLETFKSFENITNTFITFGSYALRDKDSSDAFDTLTLSNSVHDLDFTENQIGKKSILSLSSFLRRHSSWLTNLNLSRCQITTNLFSELYGFELTSLKKLYLNNNILFDLKSFVKCPNLKVISLVDCHLTDKSLHSILKSIGSSPLKKIDISSNQLLTTNGIKYMLTIQLISTLSHLTVRKMSHVIRPLIPIIRKCIVLKHLDIGDNQFDKDGYTEFINLVGPIGASLESSFGDEVHTLLLDDIKFPAECSFNWLSRLMKLQKLDLSMNDMGSKLSALSTTLTICLKLTTIRMSRSQLSKLGVVTLLYRLPSQVENVNFSFNETSQPGIYQSKYQAFNLPNLKSLELKGCGFTKQDPLIEQLIKLQQQNEKNDLQIDILSLLQ